MFPCRIYNSIPCLQIPIYTLCLIVAHTTRCILYYVCYIHVLWCSFSHHANLRWNLFAEFLGSNESCHDFGDHWNHRGMIKSPNLESYLSKLYRLYHPSSCFLNKSSQKHFQFSIHMHPYHSGQMRNFASNRTWSKSNVAQDGSLWARLVFVVGVWDDS